MKLGLTIEEIDAGLARTDLTQDDRALLWMYRARLLGVGFRPEMLTLVMGLSREEAGDTIARLAERGLIEPDDANGDGQ